MSYVGKGLTILFWIASVYNWVAPQATPLGAFLSWVALAVFIIHVLEVIFFSRRFAAAGHKLTLGDQVQIVIFGGFHLMRLLKKERAAIQLAESGR